MKQEYEKGVTVLQQPFQGGQKAKKARKSLPREKKRKKGKKGKKENKAIDSRPMQSRHLQVHHINSTLRVE